MRINNQSRLDPDDWKILEDAGGPELYLHLDKRPTGSVTCVHVLMFTVAIMDDMNSGGGFNQRWCYHTIEAATRAYLNWSGEDQTEPEGWHRHPTTGRRRDVNGVETIKW